MPRLAVLGHPVAHSRSPAMQNAALEALGLAGEWSYGAIDVVPEDFEHLVRDLAAGGEYCGVNVTVPHKLAALAVVDESSDAARSIGAANTLTFADGRIRADNTDAPGIVESLPRDPAGLNVLVLGAGGTARAAAWALGDAGANVAIWNRTGSKAVALAGELGGEAVTAAWVGSHQAELDLIVNTTTVGMDAASPAQALVPGFDDDPLKALPVAADAFTEDLTVVDLVYGSIETPLIAAARRAGAATVDGLEVLVRQGAASLRIWTGLKPPAEIMRAAAIGGG